MLDEQRKLELIGDSLIRIFTIELLNEHYPNLPYPYFYGGLLSVLTSNAALQRIRQVIKLSDKRFDPDTYKIPEHAKKRDAMAFETAMAIIYQTEGIEKAKEIFGKHVFEQIDLSYTVKMRHSFGSINSKDYFVLTFKNSEPVQS
jgi:dsRNA-specific ribonuclease